MSGRGVVCSVAVALVSMAATSFGGWAVVTVENPPEYLVAGKPVELVFKVRQHGMEVMTNVRPQVEARGPRGTAVGRVVAGQKSGEYVGTFTPTTPGMWQVTIHSGWGKSRNTMLPVPAIAAGSAAPTLPERERGRLLFVAKGCVSCHVRDGVGVESEAAGAGPELSGRSFPREYLAAFLENPSIKPRTNRNQSMPNLGLRSTEIAALVSYINSERAVSSR